jgi:3D-(3,5/4)-trihydroxycyclohexane-1,2-dione acylhydrolase (decyclizing)
MNPEHRTAPLIQFRSMTSGSTVRLTVGQAVVRFLAAQRSERDGSEHRLFARCAGIAGHGNVTGPVQTPLETELLETELLETELLETEPLKANAPGLRYYQARSEQAMVYTAVGFARMRNRLSAWACTSSSGPGATNMVTGAALATSSRLPVLLLPADVFATRPAPPGRQELEYPGGPDVSVNDAFRPVSVFFDRIWRPEQLPAALLAAARVLTDPAQTGAVTLALPQDVQAEAWDWPAELFAERVWHIPRPAPETVALIRAVQLIRASSRPLIVAGGGVIYSEASEELRFLAEAAGIPVAETQAGKGSLRYDHPLALGAIGADGTAAANQLARQADVVIGIGTRYSDVTPASRTAFANPRVRFVNINIAAPDAVKLSGSPVVADAQMALRDLARALGSWSTSDAYRAEARQLAAAWDEAVGRSYALGHQPLPAASEVIGAVNEAAEPTDVVVGATGSMPGALQKLWRTRDPKGYQVEYGYAAMGYEIAGGLGVKLADPDREVFVLVDGGSYLMMAQDLVTAVQQRSKLIVVLADHHELPADLAAIAQILGVQVLRTATIAEFAEALAQARRWTGGPVLVRIETDPAVPAPASQAWWDVPVAEVSELDPTRQARAEYESAKTAQRSYLAPPESLLAARTGVPRPVR